MVRAIGELARQQKARAYLVGGPVRDLMLGARTIDLDITVEGNGIRLADHLAKLYPGSTVAHYPAFKTATVRLPDGRRVDLATARKETYTRGGAYPKVSPSKIKDDLFRRDFTINATALSINPDDSGKLLDPFKGMADLKSKKIRVLHAQSFVDDPTRILRAARFMARLGFTLEAKTLKLLKSAIERKVLDTITPQRYLKDFKKIEAEPWAGEAVRILKAWQALRSQ